MYNKRAISDVVSTVLIILLVVAAVAIIGAIIINTVGKTGQQVDLGVQCQTLSVTPTKCNNITATSSPANVSVTWTRNAAGSDVKVSQVTIIVQDSSGVTVNSTSVSSGLPSALGSLTNYLNGPGIISTSMNNYKATIAATVTSSDGTTTKLCDPAPAIVCTTG